MNISKSQLIKINNWFIASTFTIILYDNLVNESKNLSNISKL